MTKHKVSGGMALSRFLCAFVLVFLLISYGCSGGGSDKVTRDISGDITAYGSPLAGVTVTLSGDASKTATTDTNGHYLFSAVEDGNYAVAPSFAGYNFSPGSIALSMRGADATKVNFDGVTIGMLAMTLHTVYMDNNYSVSTWGLNADGQLGDGSIVDKHAPVAISSLSSIVAVSAGDAHTVARMSDGTLRVWGSNSANQLGDGTGAVGGNSLSPITPSNLSGYTVTAVSAGDAHTIAIMSDGIIRTWGDNTNGQLGNGASGGNTATPVTPNNLTGLTMTAVSAGYQYSVALCSDGTVWTWGLNTHGQLGNNSTTDSNVPVKALGGLTGVIAISAGHDNTASGASHTVALDSSGNVWAWGNNNDGQLGDGNGGAGVVQTTPVQITKPPKMANAIVVAAGYDHTVALCSDGTVWTWGNNSNGQLGDGNSGAGVIQKKPIKVPGLTNIMHVAAGYKSTIARRKDGTIWAWGNNSNGQLGDGTTTDQTSPIKIK